MLILHLLSRWKKKSVGGSCKKHKSDKSTGKKPMILIDWDLDEIGDTAWFVMEDIWGSINDQYKFVLTEVQKAFKEL